MKYINDTEMVGSLLKKYKEHYYFEKTDQYRKNP